MAADRDRPAIRHRLFAELGSMLRFGVVGIGASATYIVVALAAERAGLSPQQANLVGVIASTLTSFFGHLFYSFRRDGITGQYITRFLVLSLAVYALSRAGTSLGVTYLGWPYWIVVLSIAVTMPLFTWTAGRFWVFR